MAKGVDAKKNVKKEPLKTPKEKKEEKREKKAKKNWTNLDKINYLNQQIIKQFYWYNYWHQTVYYPEFWWKSMRFSVDKQIKKISERKVMLD